eukprot:2671377-Amphidinium_carterae.1
MNVPPRPGRAVPIPQRYRDQQDDQPTKIEKNMQTVLKLRRDNFVQQGQDKTFLQQQLLQEFIRRTYIQHHPTSGYDEGTDEMKTVYDSYEIYNWHDELSPVKTREDEAGQLPTFRQLLTTSFTYAPEFYNLVRGQSLQRWGGLAHTCVLPPSAVGRSALARLWRVFTPPPDTLE